MKRWGFRYTEEEKLRLDPSKTDKQLAEELQRSAEGIYHIRKKCGIHKQAHRRWTSEEENYLRLHAPSTDRFTLATHLNRHPRVVYTHLRDLDIPFKKLKGGKRL